MHTFNQSELLQAYTTLGPQNFFLIMLAIFSIFFFLVTFKVIHSTIYWASKMENEP